MSEHNTAVLGNPSVHNTTPAQEKRENAARIQANTPPSPNDSNAIRYKRVFDRPLYDRTAPGNAGYFLGKELDWGTDCAATAQSTGKRTVQREGDTMTLWDTKGNVAFHGNVAFGTTQEADDWARFEDAVRSAGKGKGGQSRNVNGSVKRNRQTKERVFVPMMAIPESALETMAPGSMDMAVQLLPDLLESASSAADEAYQKHAAQAWAEYQASLQAAASNRSRNVSDHVYRAYLAQFGPMIHLVAYATEAKEGDTINGSTLVRGVRSAYYERQGLTSLADYGKRGASFDDRLAAYEANHGTGSYSEHVDAIKSALEDAEKQAAGDVDGKVKQDA